MVPGPGCPSYPGYTYPACTPPPPYLGTPTLPGYTPVHHPGTPPCCTAHLPARTPAVPLTRTLSESSLSVTGVTAGRRVAERGVTRRTDVVWRAKVSESDKVVILVLEDLREESGDSGHSCSSGLPGPGPALLPALLRCLLFNCRKLTKVSESENKHR